MKGRWLMIAHHLPVRTRFRIPGLRHDPAGCEQVADRLAAVPGVREIKVRPYTGSVLIEHEPSVAISSLVDVMRDTLAIDRILAEGEKPPLDPDVPPFSTLAQKVVTAVRELDRDIRRGSDGTVDLGMLATLGLLGAGATEIAITGRLPVPPWFNLAWWGFRTFMTTEVSDASDDCGDAADDSG
ncbi:MAG TPA: hypothetical protein VIV11_28565 [Kofleriaceae bacterium]